MLAKLNPTRYTDSTNRSNFKVRFPKCLPIFKHDFCRSAPWVIQRAADSNTASYLCVKQLLKILGTGF